MGRFIFIVLDGVGIGALPDADAYGDAGSDTLGNLSRLIPLKLPFLERCGLGNIAPIYGVRPVDAPLCMPGRLAPQSVGKDTTVGHWEHMGLVTARPFPTYADGFPDDVIGSFTTAIGRGVLGNRPASGTAIIEELGEQHLASGLPIVYTSADSVFQIAAHVDVVSVDELYTWCRAAREVLQGKHGVARVIARPFSGPPGAFVRTKDRRDFSLEPPGRTYLDELEEIGIPVVALGKISEIFAGRGVSYQIKVASNKENLSVLAGLVRGTAQDPPFDEGLIITNLVDFDMLWGHRNDVDGFVTGLESVDSGLAAIFQELRPDDMVLITADHGVDPTTPSTDHSREYVPVLLFPNPSDAPRSVYEGGFADTGATVYEWLTGRQAALEGDAMGRLLPRRGWGDYTACVSGGSRSVECVPVRNGPRQVDAAAKWLACHGGEAPGTAVVLGSGLVPQIDAVPLVTVPYEEVPHWAPGKIPGHACVLTLLDRHGERIVLLQGRVHEYEGHEEGDVQMPVRSLAAWGVRNVILTSASGAIADTLGPGEVISVAEVVEARWVLAEGRAEISRLTVTGPAARGFTRGVHASLPGPQYETPAELALLRRLGAHTVSMSPAAELRAAAEAKMSVAVLAVVVNAGETTHEEVLRGAAAASASLSVAIERLLEDWGVTA